MISFSRETVANLVMIAALAGAIGLPLASADPDKASNKSADSSANTDKTETDGEPSIDDLLKLTDPNKPKKNPTTDPNAKTKKGEAIEMTAGQAADAFVAAVMEMKQAASRLGGYQDPGLNTQRLQESILRRLDQVIKAKQRQNQKQSQSSSGSSSKKQETGSKKNQKKQSQGQKQGSSSSANKGQFSPGNADTKAKGVGTIEESRVEWGQLPSRLRNELDQGLGEKFSPIYKKLTEAYYRRLAEEGKE